MKYFLSFYFIVLISYSFSQSNISIDNVSFHIDYLASDSMRGRYPGTYEDEHAAKYILSQFKANNLKPLADDGFQNFNITNDLFYEKNNSLTGKKLTTKLFYDFVPAAFSGNDSIEKYIAFAGYGIDDFLSNNTWNDYKNIDAKNKILIILEGSPVSSKQNFDLNISIFDKINIAKTKGCAGILFVAGYNERKEDALPPIYIDTYTHQENIPIAHITRKTADKIIKNSKKSISTLEEIINKNNKPYSFEIATKIKLVTHIRYIKKSTHNVIGLLESNNQNYKNEYIIIGAHYDHLGIGGVLSGSRMPDTLAIHNGADDNASGVAGIIELARYLNLHKDTLKRSIIFVAFSGEEEGLIGSKYFISNPIVKKQNIKSMINFDMIGRFDEENRTFSLGGIQTANEYEKIINSALNKSPIDVELLPKANAPSDHYFFYQNKISVLFFHTGLHEDYHTPFDDSDKIKYNGMEKILDFAASIIINLSREEKISYKKN